jgi:hypothetical protein
MLISLTRNDYEPDICYFGQAKAAALKPRQMRFPAPDLIVEVISPSTEKIDRTIKFEDYAAHGVDEYWIVDPRKKTIEQYLLATDRYAVAAKSRGGKLKSRAIKGLEIPVRAAFDAGENLRALARIIGPPSNAELFLAFRHRLGSGFKTDLGMRAVAERLVRAGAAAAKTYFFLGLNFIALCVQKRKTAGDGVGSGRAYLNRCISHRVSP